MPDWTRYAKPPRCQFIFSGKNDELTPDFVDTGFRSAMMDVIDLAGDLRHSIETRNQIHACLAPQWDETKDETPLEKRFGRRHGDRRQVWWLSPDDRKWLRFPDRYHCQPSLFQQGVVGAFA